MISSISDAPQTNIFGIAPLSIYRYTGVKALTELDVCPAEIWDRIKGNDRRNEAIKRGGLLEKAFRNSILLANYSATDGTQDLGVSPEHEHRWTGN